MKRESFRAVNQILDALERAKSDASSDVALPSDVDAATLQPAPLAAWPAELRLSAALMQQAPPEAPPAHHRHRQGYVRLAHTRLFRFTGFMAGRHVARCANACCIRMATQQRPASCILAQQDTVTPDQPRSGCRAVWDAE